jgi:putative ubiquitin-RnfH superfamily antitoxin RatB of RatAB toxin-antitoxin module
MANPLGASMSVEVIYALPHRAIRKVFDIAAPATVEAVLCLAAADPEFAAIDTKNCTAGVFGQVARQLTADPKNARRERVKEARKRRR